MEINSQALSLLDYIGNSEQAKTNLQDIANNYGQDVRGGLDVLDSGLGAGQFEETFALLEAGEVDIDLNLVENYYQFNASKLDRELTELSERYSLDADIEVILQDGALIVQGDSDNAEAVQQYLDKDTRLATLVQQTSKLSQFVEWGQAKEQATEYQANDISEEDIVSFLQDAREVFNQDDTLVLSPTGAGFTSRGHTQNLVNAISDGAEA